MTESPRPIRELFALFKALNGKPYRSFRRLLHNEYYHDRYMIRFDHIQGSPGAFPASVCRLIIGMDELRLPGACLASVSRETATADFLLRAFADAVGAHARQNRGAQGSGSFQPLDLPPQVISRNMVLFAGSRVRITFHISLPGSHDNCVLGEAAVQMLDMELTGIIDTLASSIARGGRLEMHCRVVEDMQALQKRLPRMDLVAFIGDGAVLPRASGVAQAPLRQGAVPLRAPDELAVVANLPNAGPVRGLGIRSGINAIIGAAFHGKSTLLQALAMGVYPHIPGDGRELVVTHPHAMVISAEEGRAVNGVDISGFIHDLPDRSDAGQFRTQNASGSTSQAAAVVEAVLAGAKLFIIDEDTSAANFLLKDHHIRRLLPEGTITPLSDRIEELYQRWGISTVMAVGGSAAHLGAAHHVIAMRHYQPVSMTDQVRQLGLPTPVPSDRPLEIEDRRRVAADNFDPSYASRRLGKTMEIRIKPLRLQEKILEYGNQLLDLTALSAVVDPYQISAIGYALLLGRKIIRKSTLSPSELGLFLDRRIEKGGLDTLLPDGSVPHCLARPRPLELTAAINRLRDIDLIINKEKRNDV